MLPVQFYLKKNNSLNVNYFYDPRHHRIRPHMHVIAQYHLDIDSDIHQRAAFHIDQFHSQRTHKHL